MFSVEHRAFRVFSILSSDQPENKQSRNGCEYSDCPDNAGDLGYFPRGQMVQAFEDVAFSMEAGQVSEVFQSEIGLMATNLALSRVCNRIIIHIGLTNLHCCHLVALAT